MVILPIWIGLSGAMGQKPSNCLKIEQPFTRYAPFPQAGAGLTDAAMRDSFLTSDADALPPVAVILLAGGSGERAGFSRPKQCQTLGRKTVLQWSLDIFAAHPAITECVLVADAAVREFASAENWHHAEPGSERQQSVANGLAHLGHLADDHIILIHDAARPGVDFSVINRLVDALVGKPNSAAIPTLPVPDTLVSVADHMAGDVLDRSALARVQTPQAFRLGHLRKAHELAKNASATDDAQIVRALGVDLIAVPGDARLHKLTYAEDLTILAALLNAGPLMRTAVGMGYDVHRLVPDRPLWLGGIMIAHSHGLAGHSDADVALHALTDAIFGALADGDIGDHFPPSDEEWRGAASDRFLAFAGGRVSQRGGTITHLDLTIIAEAPKIGPHRSAIRERISEILNISIDRVSVKATTSERLGFTGRREGIAAHAVATLNLPEN